MDQKRKWLLGCVAFLAVSVLVWGIFHYRSGGVGSIIYPTEGSLQISSKPRLAPVDERSIVTELVNDNNQFAFDLYKQLGQGRTDNLFFSPYIVSQGMAMAYAGARGETASQVSTVLHFPQPIENVHAGFNSLDQTLTKNSSPDVELKIANSLWGQAGYEFSPEFLDILKRYYGTGIHTTDFRNSFKAVSEINNWIRDTTNGKIDNAISEPLGENTGLILANAMYLNAKWQDPFKGGSNGAFYSLAGWTKSVPMMSYEPNSLNNKQIFFRYAEGDHYQIVGIPYMDGKIEMVIILPEKGQFKQIEANLSGESVQAMLAGSRSWLVNLTMPKFHLEPPILSLKSALSEMGMVEPFSDAADFSGIDQEHSLKIGDITQKTYIQVDENGTEAAAAGITEFELISGILGVAEVTVDHPFIFFIRDTQTGTILFLGRVTDLP